jgi:hypothetical protein
VQCPVSQPPFAASNPEDRHCPHNLLEPVDANQDRGAHGDFDARAHSVSPQLWTNTHRIWLFVGGLLVLGGIGSLIWHRQGN